MYVVGGWSTSGRTAALQILDFASETWSYGAPIPVATDWGAAAWLDAELHFVGGITNDASATTQHLVYDPEANEWRAGTPLPVGRAGIAAVARDLRLFVFAGNSGASPAHTSSTLIYDAGADLWSNGADVPGDARINWSGALSGDRFFLAGGGTEGLQTSADLLAYHAATDSWEQMSPMPLPREAHGVASAMGIVCVVGGREAAGGNFNEPFDNVSCYSPATDTWYPAPSLPRARQEVAAVAIGDALIALGGADADATSLTDVTVLRLEPPVAQE